MTASPISTDDVRSNRRGLRSWISEARVLLISLVAFTIWVSFSSFRDPDAFYHMKMTLLMIEKGWAVTSFEWLPFTTIEEYYVDHHLLYHAVLVPFFLALGPFPGMKVATILFASLAMTMFHHILRQQHVRWATAFTLLALFSNGFAFRMSLSKASSFTMVILLGLFVLILRRQWLAVGIVSFFYVWSHGGFAIALVMGCLYGASVLGLAVVNTSKWPTWLDWKVAAVPTAVIATGICLGLIIHPSFPDHFPFYWQQLVQIGIVNYGDVIDVGDEWYGLSFLVLTVGQLQISLLLLAAIPAFLLTVKKQTVPSTTAFLFTLLLTAMTLKSSRFIEFFVPWSILFGALSLQASGWLAQIAPHREDADGDGPSPKVSPLLICTFALFGMTIAGHNSLQVYRNIRSTDVLFEQHLRGGQWLEDNATKGDIVFHSEWTDFPMLFLRSDKVRYIVGLDPTFFYNQNRDLYWKWSQVIKGEETDLVSVIKDDFNARFLVVAQSREKMKENVVNSGAFTEVYSDDTMTIFRVP